MHPQTKTPTITLDRPPTIRRAEPRDRDAVLALLTAEEHLEAVFDPSQFWVAERDDRVVACARLKPLDEASSELASVAVTPFDRKRRVGARLVSALLATAPPTVYALALAPGFFLRAGFTPIAEAQLPPALLEKANGMCKSTGFVPMVLRSPADC